jgi:hypothetical protein
MFDLFALARRFLTIRQERRRRAWAMLEVLELFGRPLRVKVWDRNGDRRVFVGPYSGNDLEYYDGGDHWHPPRTLWAAGAIRDYAARTGCTEPEAEARFRAFCEQLLQDWHTLTIWPEQFPKSH